MHAEERRPGMIQALALLLPITMAVMGSVVLQPVQGLLTEHFSSVPGKLYWVPFLLTVPAIAATCFTVPAGYLADLLGRRILLLVAMVFYVALGVAPFFLQGLLPIALSRIGVGLTEGVVLTVTTTLLADYFKGRARDRLLGFQAAIATVSASLLIPLSGYLGSRIGWNGPFLIYGLAAVWLVGILLFTWEPSPDAGAGEKQGSASWAGFPWKNMLVICVVTLFGACFFYTVQFEGPTILPDFGIVDPARIGFLMGLASWGMVAGAIGFQLVVNRSTGVLLFGELVLIAGSFFAMSRAASADALVAASFMNQVACGALLPTLLTACMRLLPFEHRGRGAGIWQATLASGQFLVGMSFPVLTQLSGGSKLRALNWLALAAGIAAVGAFAFVCRAQVSRISSRRP